MADIMTVAERSARMALIRGRGNKSTEDFLARMLRVARVTGWRRHLPIKGRPDFVFRAAKMVIFVDGCFWHGCPKHFKAPRSRADFWDKKISGNRLRDARVTRALRREGWLVVRIWEHDLCRAGAARVLARVRAALDLRVAPCVRERQ